jgi:hypothetical protein
MQHAGLFGKASQLERIWIALSVRQCACAMYWSCPLETTGLLSWTTPVPQKALQNYLPKHLDVIVTPNICQFREKIKEFHLIRSREFWGVTQCSLVEDNWRFIRICCLPLRSRCLPQHPLLHILNTSKFSVHSMKACWGRRRWPIPVLILNFDTKHRCVVNSTPRPPYLQKRTLVHIKYEAGLNVFEKTEMSVCLQCERPSFKPM